MTGTRSEPRPSGLLVAFGAVVLAMLPVESIV